MPDESGLIDGDLPHAIERVLPTSVLVAGYKLADSDDHEGTQARDKGGALRSFATLLDWKCEQFDAARPQSARTAWNAGGQARTPEV